LFVVYFVDYGEKETNLFNKFKPVTLKDNLSHVVQKIEMPDKAHKNFTGSVNVIFKDDIKLRICTRPCENSKTTISELIEPGDSIVKHSGSDTVYLYKSYSRKAAFDDFFLLEGEGK
jgi:hypothetical protein